QYMGMTVEMYKEQAKESALKNVKIRLALEKIAALENLDVTEEDIEAEYKKFAEQYGMEVDKIKEVVPVDGLKADMLKERAIFFVKDNAKVTTARKPRAKKEEAPAE
ncbi:MAG: trigger factor, partial [Clostridia bacterium]|nr:trigger factor [Clostridia bacterium]